MSLAASAVMSDRGLCVYASRDSRCHRLLFRWQTGLTSTLDNATDPVASSWWKTSRFFALCSANIINNQSMRTGTRFLSLSQSCFIFHPLSLCFSVLSGMLLMSLVKSFLVSVHCACHCRRSVHRFFSAGAGGGLTSLWTQQRLRAHYSRYAGIWLLMWVGCSGYAFVLCVVVQILERIMTDEVLHNVLKG